jgi:hypothetical protein
MIGTLVAIAVGTRYSDAERDRKATRLAVSRHNDLLPKLSAYTAWLDALSDADAWQYATHILGTSRGSRYADRIALVRHFTATNTF